MSVKVGQRRTQHVWATSPHCANTACEETWSHLIRYNYPSIELITGFKVPLIITSNGWMGIHRLSHFLVVGWILSCFLVINVCHCISWLLGRQEVNSWFGKTLICWLACNMSGSVIMLMNSCKCITVRVKI